MSKSLSKDESHASDDFKSNVVNADEGVHQFDQSRSDLSGSGDYRRSEGSDLSESDLSYSLVQKNDNLPSRRERLTVRNLYML